MELIGLVIATLGGTAVGLERQWSGHADGPSARFGGIRTFTMLGAVSGLSGWLLTLDEDAAAIALLAGATAIIIAAYIAEGNSGEALRHYRLFARLLHRQLQLRPSPQLNELIAPVLQR